MKASHFHSISELERAFKFQPHEMVDLLLEVRSIVVRLVPSATERLNPNGLTFYDASRGGTVKGGICGIDIRDDRLRLSFAHGVFLDDPESLLRGERLYMRFVEIFSFEDTPWDDIENLIEASVHIDWTKLDT